jgi:hypothetical protein
LILKNSSADPNGCAVSDSKPRSDLPEVHAAEEDQLKSQHVTPREGLTNRRGYLHTNSQDVRSCEVVGEHVLPTQQQRSASSEGGALNCMVSFKSMERARSTLEDFVSRC